MKKTSLLARHVKSTQIYIKRQKPDKQLFRGDEPTFKFTNGYSSDNLNFHGKSLKNSSRT